MHALHSSNFSTKTIQTRWMLWNRGGKEVDARRETRESRPQTGKASETNEKQGR